MYVFTGGSKRIKIWCSDTPIAEGTESKIYSLDYSTGGNNTLLAKIYKTDNRDQLNALHEHIKRLIDYKLPDDLSGYKIAWPKEIITNEKGEFIGYSMTSVPGMSLEREIRKGIIKKTSIRERFCFAYIFAVFINYIHTKGLVVGDFNLSNFQLSNDDGKGYKLHLIDCGGFKFGNEHTKIRDHFSPRIRPPEILLEKQNNSTFETDLFHLADCIFAIITGGKNPFITFPERKKDTEDPDEPVWKENVKDGVCLYVRRYKDYCLPDGYEKPGLFPDDILALFSRAFNYNRDNAVLRAKNRPTAQEWVEVLSKYSANAKRDVFVKCPHNESHIYLSHLRSCPWCNPASVSNTPFLSRDNTVSNEEPGGKNNTPPRTLSEYVDTILPYQPSPRSSHNIASYGDSIDMRIKALDGFIARLRAKDGPGYAFTYLLKDIKMRGLKTTMEAAIKAGSDVETIPVWYKDGKIDHLLTTEEKGKYPELVDYRIQLSAESIDRVKKSLVSLNTRLRIEEAEHIKQETRHIIEEINQERKKKKSNHWTLATIGVYSFCLLWLLGLVFTPNVIQTKPGNILPIVFSSILPLIWWFILINWAPKDIREAFEAPDNFWHYPVMGLSTGVAIGVCIFPFFGSNGEFVGAVSGLSRIGNAIYFAVTCVAVCVYLISTIIRLQKNYFDSNGIQLGIKKQTAIRTLLIAVPILIIGLGTYRNYFSVSASGGLKVGSTIVLGSFDQDDNQNNGKESLNWTVREITDGKALIVSNICVKAIAYNTSGNSNSWRDSDVRAWLNNDFYFSTFSSAERYAISAMSIPTKRLSIKEGNTLGYSDGDADTTVDHIFILDYSQVTKLESEPSAPISVKETFFSEGKRKHLFFWVRNPLDKDNGLAYGFKMDEAKDSYFISPINMVALVMPALYIDIDRYIHNAAK